MKISNSNNFKGTIKAIQTNLNPILKRLSEGVDTRTIRNIGMATIGIINSRSTRISEITSKSRRNCKRLITDAKRNYRMLRSRTWEKHHLEKERLKSIKSKIKNNTPIGIDLSHIEHPDSVKIEGVTKIYGKNKLISGHWWLQAAARIDKRRILPLTTNIFSHATKDFVSMNSTVFDFLDNLYKYIGNKGIWLFDRGFSSKLLFQRLLSLNVKFIVRLQKKRTLLIDGEIKQLQSILNEDKYPYKSTIRMKRKPVLIKFNFKELKLPGIKERLWIVFTKSRYGESYILLTNIEVTRFDEALRIIKIYRYRWSVEDFFRVMKQDLGIEKVMLRTLRRINKLIEIAMLAYVIAFMLLINDNKLIKSIIEAGGRLGIKNKNEDTIGRILKGLATNFRENRLVISVIISGI